VNEAVANYLQQAGIELKMTGSFSPQQNGVNERNNGSADIMITKYQAENPKMSLQEAVHRAAYARNCEVSATRGLSVFQLVYGSNPNIAGLSECTTGSLETFTPNEISRQMFSKMESARRMMNEADSDLRLKLAMKDRLPKEPNRRVEIGDEVTFRDHKERVMRTGRVTGQDGEISIIKWCNHERRVPSRELMPTREKRDWAEDGDTEEDSAEEIIEPEEPSRDRGPLRKRKEEIIECPTSVDIERELKDRPLDKDVQSDESDHMPKMKLVEMSENETERERRTRRKKRKGRGTRRDKGDKRPKRRRQVRIEMKDGEIIIGRISALEKSNMDYLFIDTEFEKYRCLDIRNIAEWIYEDNP